MKQKILLVVLFLSFLSCQKRQSHAEKYADAPLAQIPQQNELDKEFKKEDKTGCNGQEDREDPFKAKTDKAVSLQGGTKGDCTVQ